jgi:glutathione S-transferase
MSIKVHYFAGYGRGEAIRMLLAFAKVDFEDVTYTFQSLPELKASGKLEFGQLPALEIDGKFYAQSIAILRYLGKKYGYYPADAYESWKVDSTIDTLGDLLNAFYRAAFAPNEETKKALFQTFYETTFPKFLDAIQKRVEGNTSKDHIVGDSITIADFALASLAYSTFLNNSNPQKDQQLAIVEKYPTLLAYFKSLGEQNKEYLEKRPQYPW